MDHPPDLSIVAIGAPVASGGEAAALALLERLQEAGLSPRAGTVTEPSTIVAERYRSYEDGRPGECDGRLRCALDVPWERPGGVRGTLVELWFKVWERDARCSARINAVVLPTVRAPFDALDAAAERAAEWAVRLHRWLGAGVTVVDSLPMRSLDPNEPEQAPLWVGWSSTYGSEICARYRLADARPPARSIIVDEAEESTAFRSPLTFSQYVATGWDEPARAFWHDLGGRLLNRV